jgi:two-component system, NtrC family, sensor histidine kinase HydH
MQASDDPGWRVLPADLARILHDLRGPLNSLTMHLEVLKRTVSGDTGAEESLRTALQQLGRLAEMIPAAMAVTSLELGPLRSVDLGALAARVRDGEGAGAVTVSAGDWPSVVGDEALLTLALAHLLRNAVEATAAGAKAPAITGTTANGEVLVQVRDWGPGLRTTNPKLLFKLLQSTKPGHRGLGLVTVERIARLHGGELRFESPGDGALVTLALPALTSARA